MRIVFWGSERGSGVTSNMLILASYLACQKGYRITMMELAEEKQEIQTYFPKVGEYYIQKYIRMLVRRQLYYVSMEEWKQQKEKTLVGLIKYLERNMDMVFINLANRTDEEAKDLMHNANLVIVNLKQEKESFEQYYVHYANLSARIFLLIGNYYEDGNCGREYLQEKYNISEEQLAVIPNNPEYQMACGRGRVDRYMKRNSPCFVSALKAQFLKNVGKTAEQIYDTAYKTVQLSNTDGHGAKNEMTH